MLYDGCVTKTSGVLMDPFFHFSSCLQCPNINRILGDQRSYICLYTEDKALSKDTLNPISLNVPFSDEPTVCLCSNFLLYLRKDIAFINQSWIVCLCYLCYREDACLFQTGLTLAFNLRLDFFFCSVTTNNTSHLRLR